MSTLNFETDGVYTTAETMFGEVMIHERLFAGEVKYMAYGLKGDGTWFDTIEDAKDSLNRVYGYAAA